MTISYPSGPTIISQFLSPSFPFIMQICKFATQRRGLYCALRSRSVFAPLNVLDGLVTVGADDIIVVRLQLLGSQH